MDLFWVWKLYFLWVYCYVSHIRDITLPLDRTLYLIRLITKIWSSKYIYCRTRSKFPFLYVCGDKLHLNERLCLRVGDWMNLFQKASGHKLDRSNFEVWRVEMTCHYVHQINFFSITSFVYHRVIIALAYNLVYEIKKMHYLGEALFCWEYYVSHL